MARSMEVAIHDIGSAVSNVVTSSGIGVAGVDDGGLELETRVRPLATARSTDALIDLADRRPASEEERPQMGIASHDDTERAVTRALGEELRRVRDSVGWTRAELVDQLPSDIHARTLANYEQGNRHCTVARFVEICEVLGVAAPDVLGLALQRAKIQLLAVSLQVDLHALLHDRSNIPEPLRRWARNRLASSPNSHGTARLSMEVIDEMAALLDISSPELVSHLVPFTPESASRRSIGQ
jgi:transcriptional regulator with XRE-family HTH domain